MVGFYASRNKCQHLRRLIDPSDLAPSAQESSTQPPCATAKFEDGRASGQVVQDVIELSHVRQRAIQLYGASIGRLRSGAFPAEPEVHAMPNV